MILKVVNYEKREGKDGAWEVANYIDGVINASVTFDDEEGFPAVKCSIENGTVISISVRNIAYLMNNNGKTIDRIACDGYEKGENYPQIHDAIDAAIAGSLE